MDGHRGEMICSKSHKQVGAITGNRTYVTQRSVQCPGHWTVLSERPYPHVFKL